MSKVISTGFLSEIINGIKINSTIQCHYSYYKSYNSRSVSFIVVHYTGNAKDTAKGNANYFKSSGNRIASAHLFVDDTSIYQSVKLRDKANHCGTSGKYYHASCRNTNSIGIEMCTSGNYKVSKKTQENTAYLCAYLCKKLGITENEVDKYVLRHYDVTHKSCPAQMSGSNNKEWSDFKNMIKNILKNGSLDSTKNTTETSKTDSVVSSRNITATGKASKFNKSISGSYKTTANLNLRDNATVSSKSLVVIPKDTKVMCYGYYSITDNVKWYYVQYTKGNITYTGFSSSKYLKKV